MNTPSSIPSVNFLVLVFVATTERFYAEGALPLLRAAPTRS